MAGTPKPIADLRTLRESLLERHRAIAAAATDTQAANNAFRREPDAGANLGADFRKVQEEIEAVDRALNEERGDEGRRKRQEVAESVNRQMRGER